MSLTQTNAGGYYRAMHPNSPSELTAALHKGTLCRFTDPTLSANETHRLL